MGCCLDKKDLDNIYQFIHSVQCSSVDFMMHAIKNLSTAFSFEHATFMSTDDNEHYLDLVGYNISDKMIKKYKDYYHKTDIFLPQNFTGQFSVSQKSL